MRKFSAVALVWLLFAGALAGGALAQSVSLLPNGEQTFVDQNGQPYSSGQVYFYIPSTTTPKTTWSDAGGSVPNSNPVVLDSAGRAVIYGSGQYRQVLRDQFGNTIWDQVTSGPTNAATFPTATGNVANDLVCMQNTATSIKDCGFAASPGQYPGVSTNTAASSGNIGQTISANVNQSATTGLTTMAATDVTSISVPAGSWSICGNVGINTGGGTTVTFFGGWVSTSSMTVPVPPNGGAGFFLQGSFTGGSNFPTGCRSYLLSGTTTVYLTVDSTFSGGTAGDYGYIQATRQN